MADVFDAEKRSDIMQRVKSKKNKSTELRLIEIFKDHGITGWRRNYPVKGHPDFVFPKEKRRTGAGLRSEQHLSPTMSMDSRQAGVARPVLHWRDPYGV